jgi:hypothetical protein
MGATFSISTSPHIMAGSFPPLLHVSADLRSLAEKKAIRESTDSSSVTLFRVLAALCMTSFPVAEEPVKLILSIPGWLVIHGPRLSFPLRAWKTPGGKNRWPSSASFSPPYGV